VSYISSLATWDAISPIEGLLTMIKTTSIPGQNLGPSGKMNSISCKLVSTILPVLFTGSIDWMVPCLIIRQKYTFEIGKLSKENRLDKMNAPTKNHKG